jgi:hypothetical protein
MARISLRPQTQVVLEWQARKLKLRIMPSRSQCRQPRRPNAGASGCGLPENWRPSPEDEAFARRRGMNPKGVTHALRNDRPDGSDAKGGGSTDGSAVFRAWIEQHAVEAPRYFPVIFTGT